MLIDAPDLSAVRRVLVMKLRQHPLFGAGTGGFALAYADVVRGSGLPVTHNPHTEYLERLTADQGRVA